MNKQKVGPIRKEVYPVTATFEKDTKHLIDVKRELSLSKIQSIFQEVVGEYEHGSADVIDIEGVNIKQYSAVAHDLLLCLEHWYEPGEKNES
jgi:hypothetical protein